MDTDIDYRDAMFNVLSNARRRFTLQHLRGADTPIKVGELTTEIAAWEARRPGTEQSAGDAESIEVSLLHSHLPKMDDAGVVAYDAPQRTVALTDHNSQVQSHLDVIAND